MSAISHLALASAFTAAPLTHNAPTLVTISPLAGLPWAKFCLETYPEIQWLGCPEVRATEEGTSSAKAPYSEQIFGAKYIEFDRTLMTLHCLRLILDGSEEAFLTFTENQPALTRLTSKSFHSLHEAGKELLARSADMRQLFESALVLGDIGKSEAARAHFHGYCANPPDHDDFHAEALKALADHPELSPTFFALSGGARDLLQRTANLAHYGHITHLEGDARMFEKLAKSRVTKEEFLFDFFVHSCDVAGAAGHVDNSSSLTYTEEQFIALEAVKESCLQIVEHGKTPTDAYRFYLQRRANLLDLDPTDPVESALTRLGAMMRLFTREQGFCLQEGAHELEAKWFESFDVSVEKPGRTPTYMPAVLVNLMNNKKLGPTSGERIMSAIELGVPFLVRVLKAHQELIAAGKIDANIPLCFNKAAGAARDNPEKLRGEFSIDREGNVVLGGS